MDGVPQHLNEFNKSDAEVTVDALLAAGAITDEQHQAAVRHIREHNARMVEPLMRR